MGPTIVVGLGTAKSEDLCPRDRKTTLRKVGPEWAVGSKDFHSGFLDAEAL